MLPSLIQLAEDRIAEIPLNYIERKGERLKIEGCSVWKLW
jgi:hypothetical protein